MLKLISSCDDDSNADYPQIEQQPEIIQIAVEKGIFVIPFHFKSDLIFETVYFVCWGIMLHTVHYD